MSDSIKNQAFKSTSWGSAGQVRPDEAKGAPPSNGEGFRSLYAHPEQKGTVEGFTASFISEEKARKLAVNQVKSPPVPTPEAPSPEVSEEIRRQAYEEGVAQGREAGLAEGRQQSREIVDRMTDIAAQIESAWGSLIQTHESRLIELVTRAVEKVVYGQAALEQEMVKRAILEALRVVPEPVNVHISVNPKDYEYIETIKEDFFARIKALKDVSVTPDPAIHTGGCHVRTKFGEVDATLESRLEAIRECLLKANGKKVGGA